MIHYNEGYPSDIVALSPQGTNSTFFTACCSVAICDDQGCCPGCVRPVVGHNLSTTHERHLVRWKNATRFWKKDSK